MVIPQALIVQVVGYAVVIGLVFFILSFMQRGFFWKFIKVKTSMGRLILVKVRSINIDHYVIGKIEEDFLIFKVYKQEKRLAINDRNVFYKSIGINWVDVDDSRNCLVKPDFTTSPGFDVVLYNNLYLRALYKPAITDNLEKIMLVLIIVCTLASVICVILIMKESSAITSLQGQIGAIATQIKGQVVQTATI